ncbi:hypothetical protein RSAG8_11823, partial [Rhizoctonia solani AG-8 WAC10335]
MRPDDSATEPHKDENDMLTNSPPVLPVFNPHGLLLAATVVNMILDYAPGQLEPPLVVSNTHALATSLRDSIDRSTISGPLLPRHSHSLDDLPRSICRVKISEMPDTWCRRTTRIDTKTDLTRVRKKLGIPDVFRTSQRDRFDVDEALAILLSRITYPSRLFDLSTKWGRDIGALSRCVSELSDFLFQQWKHLFVFDPDFHSPSRLERYATAISAAGSPIDDIWGFIDGTVIEICRPKEDQDVVYNGYKKHHALKFQAIVTPDGLMRPVYGPVEGCRADGGVLEMSGLEKMCLDHAKGMDGRQLFVYGDSAYGVSDAILSGVKKIGKLTSHEQDFNCKMSKLRQSVEWGFGNVANNFAYIDYDKGLKLGLHPVGQLYLLSILFTNIRACLYSNEISHKFQCPPPTIDDYLTPVS